MNRAWRFDGGCVAFRLNDALNSSWLAVFCEWLVVSVFFLNDVSNRQGFGKVEQ